jgi:hypothetical protein
MCILGTVCRRIKLFDIGLFANINDFAAKVRSVRTADLYAMRSERPVSALNVEMCIVQHLSLSALSCRWRPPQDAAARPVEPDFRAFCSIFAG